MFYYEEKFRCRMCGFVYWGARTRSAKDALQSATKAENNQKRKVHFCKSGCMGVVDFLGYVRCVENEGDA